MFEKEISTSYNEKELESNHLKNEISLQEKPRIYFLDNLRILLTILVILHHIAITYGGDGGWPIFDPSKNPSSQIVLTVFTTYNQAFFMAFFFMISAYFLPRSYEKKGTLKFLFDRFIRIGVPLIIYLLFLDPLGNWIISNYYIYTNLSYLTIFTNQITTFSYSFGVTWFLLALLIFNVCYIIIFEVSKLMKLNISLVKFKDSFPTNFVIIIGIFVVAIITFLVRLATPVGEQIFTFQLAHFTQYIFFFFFGIMAYKSGWLNNIKKRQGRTWGIVMVATLPLAPLVLWLEGAMEHGIGNFLGGFTWQSAIYVLWESVICFSTIIFLSYFFRSRFNKKNKFAQIVSKNAYTAYIIQAIIIYIFTLLFLNISMHPLLKFVLVSPIVVIVTFLVSFIIRQIPFAKKSLG
jgi:hypothetical protein